MSDDNTAWLRTTALEEAVKTFGKDASGWLTSTIIERAEEFYEFLQDLPASEATKAGYLDCAVNTEAPRWPDDDLCGPCAPETKYPQVVPKEEMDIEVGQNVILRVNGVRVWS